MIHNECVMIVRSVNVLAYTYTDMYILATEDLFALFCALQHIHLYAHVRACVCTHTHMHNLYCIYIHIHIPIYKFSVFQYISIVYLD